MGESSFKNLVLFATISVLLSALLLQAPADAANTSTLSMSLSATPTTSLVIVGPGPSPITKTLFATITNSPGSSQGIQSVEFPAPAGVTYVLNPAAPNSGIGGSCTASPYNWKNVLSTGNIIRLQKPSNGAALDNGKSCKVTFTTSANDGTYTFSVKTYKSAQFQNNHSTATSLNNVLYDGTKPITQITNVADGNIPPRTLALDGTAATNSQFVSITFTATDGTGSGVANSTCKLDNQTPYTCTSVVTIGPVGDGTHTVTIWSTDKAGNVESTATFTWSVDSTPPTIVITTPSVNALLSIINGGLLQGGELSVSGTADDNGGSGVDKVEYGVDSIPSNLASGITSWSFQTLVLVDGTHAINVRATDKAGNSADASITVTVDNSPPVSVIDSATDGNEQPVIDLGVTRSDSITFAFHADDISPYTLECSFDGANFETCSSPHNIASIAENSPPANLRHTFYVRAVDVAGNQGSPVSFSWTVDLTSPTLTFTSISPSLDDDGIFTVNYQTSVADTLDDALGNTTPTDSLLCNPGSPFTATSTTDVMCSTHDTAGNELSIDKPINLLNVPGVLLTQIDETHAALESGVPARNPDGSGVSVTRNSPTTVLSVDVCAIFNDDGTVTLLDTDCVSKPVTERFILRQSGSDVPIVYDPNLLVVCTRSDGTSFFVLPDSTANCASADATPTFAVSPSGAFEVQYRINTGEGVRHTASITSAGSYTVAQNWTTNIDILRIDGTALGPNTDVKLTYTGVNPKGHGYWRNHDAETQALLDSADADNDGYTCGMARLANPADVQEQIESCIKLGDYIVDTSVKAAAIFDFISANTAKAFDALAGHSLAHDLSLASNANNCALIDRYVANVKLANAQRVGGGIGYDGPGSLLNPTDPIAKAEVIALKDAITNYLVNGCGVFELDLHRVPLDIDGTFPTLQLVSNTQGVVLTEILGAFPNLLHIKTLVTSDPTKFVEPEYGTLDSSNPIGPFYASTNLINDPSLDFHVATNSATGSACPASSYSLSSGLSTMSVRVPASTSSLSCIVGGVKSPVASGSIVGEITRISVKLDIPTGPSNARTCKWMSAVQSGKDPATMTAAEAWTEAHNAASGGSPYLAGDTLCKQSGNSVTWILYDSVTANSAANLQVKNDLLANYNAGKFYFAFFIITDSESRDSLTHLASFRTEEGAASAGGTAIRPTLEIVMEVL
jgi:hypothetical protein